MKKLLLITMLGVLVTAGLAAEGSVDFSGNIETLWGVGTPWTDKDVSAGRFSIGTTTFTGTIDAYYDNSSALAEGSVTYDAVNNSLDYSVDELWLDYTESFWGVRIGRQKAVWGKADGIDITNVLCPSDMSSLAAMTSDDSKLAVDAIRLSLNGNQFTADAYWIPLFTPAALPLDEGNALRKFLVPEAFELPIPEMNIVLVLPVTIDGIENPELAIWNGEYGLRVSGYFSAFDISLYGFYGWDDTPFLDYAISYGEPAIPGNPATAMPNGFVINGKYERMAMIGADAALPIGETVLRLEGAFFPQRHFQKEEGGSLQRNQISALAGIDWMPEGWTLTAQYYCDAVLEDLDKLEREETYEHGATLSISKSLVNETLEISFAGLIGFNDFDSMLSPSVEYSLSDQIKAGLKAFIFIPGPEHDGKYGAYKNLSSICLNAKFSF